MFSLYTVFKLLASFLCIVLIVTISWLFINWYSSLDFEIGDLRKGSIIEFDSNLQTQNSNNGSLTVLSYNLGFAAGPMQETLADDHPLSYYKKNLDDFIALVKDKDVDVLLLQEVDLNSKRSGYVNQLDYIMSRLGWGYAAPVTDWDLYFPLRKEHKIVKATVVLSKFPIVSNEYTLTSCKPNFENKLLNIFYYPLLWKSTMQRVKIEIGDSLISFYNVHLCVWSRAARVAQVKYLAKWMNEDQDESKFILGGDFNFQAYIRGTPLPVEDMSSPPFIRVLWDEVPGLSEVLISRNASSEQIHKNYTFPERKHRYDLMFYSKGLDFSKVEIINSIESSDHLPLRVKFRIAE